MKTCTSCHKQFDITPEENLLRQKISGKYETGPVPESRLCPDCRMQNLQAFRNERYLYRRKCDLTGKNIISIYPEGTAFPVYERNVWWGDSWNPLDYGRDFDFSRPFFEQFAELQQAVPRAALFGVNTENCDYCNFAFDAKDCYLSTCVYYADSLLHCYWMLDCKDSLDCSFCLKTEQSYDCTDCNHSYGCVSCQLCHNCSNCLFSFDLRGCSDCFGCVGLRRKTYCMFNEQLTREEYEQRLASLDLQNPETIQLIRSKLEKLRQSHPHFYSQQDKTEDCDGDYIFESKNCHDVYQIYRSEDCINVQDSETTDTLDSYHIGWSQGIYLTNSTVNVTNCAFCLQVSNGSDNFYCDNTNGTHCFGCIGLQQKSYCILNKQYTKESYEALLPKIIEHMKKTGEWGNYFPIELSPFSYNESMAQQYYPMTKEEVIQKGWKWTEHLPFTKGLESLDWQSIPDRIEETDESICKEILACNQCQRNYKISPQELAWYKRLKISLPKACPECRYQDRMKLRNHRKLCNRSCGHCGREIQTTFSPDRTEKVFCEECYLMEVN